MGVFKEIVAAIRESVEVARRITAPAASEQEEGPDGAIATWLGITPEQAAKLSGWPTRGTPSGAARA